MFTESCYIRIESDEMRERLVKELKKRGYKDYTPDIDYKYLSISKGRFLGYYYEWSLKDIQKEYSCGTNEKLFLALAALRNDSDFMQYFFYPEHDIWFLCRKNKSDHFYTEWDGTEVDIIEFIKKASKEELIKHFSK